MGKIEINDLRNSTVLIGDKIIISSEIYGYDKVLLISDTNVFRLYGRNTMQELNKSNNCVFKFLLQAGENSKSMDTVLKIVEFISKNHFSRNDLIVTLGGGVVSDLGGFTASIYKRGVKLCHIPTTILGAVDASIGGKTGVNTEFGKNILGTFYNPLKIIIDIDYFKTLPNREIICGKSEILKYAFICKPEILKFLNNGDLNRTIEFCVKIKQSFVEQDEFDFGKRMMLNFGHTIGHAIEKHSNYSINHGEAISIGMATMARYFGVDEIESILKESNLPIIYEVDYSDLIEFVRMDKKRVEDTYNLVVPIKLGECKISEFDENQVIQILKRVKG